MSSQWLYVNEIQWFVLGTNWLIKAHLPITEVKFDSVLGELPMKWRSKHVAARSQISDEVWCLKRGVAAMQGPWGGKSQSNIIKFSSAMLYRSTTNQMYPSLGFRFTSEYLHYGQVLNELICLFTTRNKQCCLRGTGSIYCKCVRSCSLAYSNSFLVSIRKINLLLSFHRTYLWKKKHLCELNFVKKFKLKTTLPNTDMN